jgi:hypothetical protein
MSPLQRAQEAAACNARIHRVKAQAITTIVICL